MTEKGKAVNHSIQVCSTRSSESARRDRKHALGSFVASVSAKLGASTFLKVLMIVLFIGLIFVRYTIDSIDYDLWWHLAHGKFYVTHRTLKINLSMFSWTPTDPTWIYNTCLGSIVVYLCYNTMAGFGLWLFQWLIFGGVFLSFYLFLRLTRQRLDVNNLTLMTAIGIACSMACRYYKPELFSLLLFSWSAFIFFYVKMTRKALFFYLYPLLFVLWVNLHGGFIVGLVFLTLAFVGEFLNTIIFPRQNAFSAKELLHFGSASVLSLLATMVNPYGPDYPISLWKGIANESSAMAQLHNRVVMAYQSLWPYLKATDISFFGGGLTAWLMTLMIFFVLGTSVYDLVQNKACDFSGLLLSLALYAKGMETNRASYFFPVAFFFLFYFLLTVKLKLGNVFRNATVLFLCLFFFFCVSVFYVHLIRIPDNKWFNRGLDDLVPVKEVEFLKTVRPEGRIFNDYAVGGYLVWALYPDYKVFIDPRGALYMNQVFYDYLAFTAGRVSREDIERFREKYPFKIVLLHYREKKLIRDFLQAGEGEWRLVYFDKNAAVLVHRSLFPVLSARMRNVDLGPLRFREVKNPQTLLQVFDFYVHLDPKAARYIYHVFKRNVKDVDGQKMHFLRTMDEAIRFQEMKLQRAGGRQSGGNTLFKS